VAGLDTDHREKIKLVDIAGIWGYIHDNVLVTLSALSVCKLGALLTEVPWHYLTGNLYWLSEERCTLTTFLPSRISTSEAPVYSTRITPMPYNYKQVQRPTFGGK
jgi:hypothetical protein